MWESTKEFQKKETIRGMFPRVWLDKNMIFFVRNGHSRSRWNESLDHLKSICFHGESYSPPQDRNLRCNDENKVTEQLWVLPDSELCFANYLCDSRHVYFAYQLIQKIFLNFLGFDGPKTAESIHSFDFDTILLMSHLRRCYLLLTE